MPILAQGALAGVVAVFDATAASGPTLNSLESLAAQVGFLARPMAADAIRDLLAIVAPALVEVA